MKHKIVLCKTEYGAFIPCSFDATPDDWVVVSEVVEVDFPELPQQVIDAQIEVIDKQIEEEKGKHFATIRFLKRSKQELLAITYESEQKQSHEEPTYEEMKQDYEDAN